MSRRLIPYAISLGFIYAVVCSPPIHGQSPPNSARCFPSLLSLASDEKAEFIGKKVFPKVIIDDVVFDGPTSLPASTREQLVGELREHAALGSTRWLEEWGEFAVRNAWMDEGFFKMTSTAEPKIISSDATEQHVSVTVHVDEGMQYRLRDIRFGKEPQVVPAAVHSVQPDSDEAPDNGRTMVSVSVLSKKVEFPEFHDSEQLDTNLVFPPQELRKRFPLSDGDVLDASRIKEGLDALSRFYHSRGYINFAATSETITDDKNATISLIMVLDEGKQFRIRSLDVQGLDQQTTGSLKWRVQPGDLYDFEFFKDFFTDNRNILPSGGASQSNHMNEERGTVDIRFVFPSCP